MNEMIERVARALATANEDEANWLSHGYVDLAKAAIEAMRTPSKAMIVAAETAFEEWADHGYDSGFGRYEIVTSGWQASVLDSMIDAALDETPHQVSAGTAPE